MPINDFKLISTKTDSNFTVFVGKIKDKDAICVVPNKVIFNDEFELLLEEDKEIIQQNDIYTTYSVKSSQLFNIRLIYPATQKHIEKYLNNNKFVTESYEEYLKLRRDMTTVQWIKNIIDGVGNEKIYYSDEDFHLIANYKWNGIASDDLQLLLIFRNENLKTIRDLESETLLIKARDVIKREIVSFGLNYEDVIVFFHYPPTYNQLHLHIENINLKNSTATSVIRAKLLSDVIYSLSVDKDFYKRELSFGCKLN
jgi:m7GpppX diphosphatase